MFKIAKVYYFILFTFNGFYQNVKKLMKFWLDMYNPNLNLNLT